MHHADEQGAAGKAPRVHVLVTYQVVRRALGAVRMSVEMSNAVRMAMRMEVDALAPQPVERVRAEADEHHTTASSSTCAACAGTTIPSTSTAPPQSISVDV